MRILIMSQWFEPEPVSVKGLLFAHELENRGHQVEVLTGFPNYPTGNLYPGYRMRLWQRETLEGITVHRVPLYPSHDRSAVRRAINYMTFANSAALLGPMLVHRPDIVYVYNLVTLGRAADHLRTMQGSAVVHDVQDLWPESVTASGMLRSRWLLRVLGRWCNKVYSSSDHVVTLSPGIRAELLRRGLPEDRVTTIYNWCDERSMQPSLRDPGLAESLCLAGGFNVVFAGNLGLAQGLRTVIEVAARLQTSHADIRFVFIGDGVDRSRLVTMAQQRGLANVLFLPRQPLDAMGPILSLADVLLVHLKDDPLFRVTIPSKTQAYLAAGRPILMAVAGDAARLVERSGGGLVCRPEDPDSLAEAVLRLHALPIAEREAMGRAGHDFYQRELSMHGGVARFEACFEQALRHRRGHRP